MPDHGQSRNHSQVSAPYGESKLRNAATGQEIGSVHFVTVTQTVSERWCASCREWLEVKGPVGALAFEFEHEHGKGNPNLYYRCHCCGDGFRTNKPQDIERDTGFGTCERCYDMVAKSWVKHGFPGERPITMEQALERLRSHA